MKTKTVHRPGKVKVGPYVYSILYVEQSDAMDLDTNGQCNQDHLWIRIRSHLAEDSIRVTLYHELFHAVVGLLRDSPHDSKVAEDNISEESWIQRVSTMMFCTMRENPDLREYLFGS